MIENLNQLRVTKSRLVSFKLALQSLEREIGCGELEEINSNAMKSQIEDFYKEINAFFDQIIQRVDSSIDSKLVSAKFGDKWKVHAIDYDKDTLINIAWRQGRRAILLQRELERVIKD